MDKVWTLQKFCHGTAGEIREKNVMIDKVNSDSTLVGSHKPAFAVACISLRIFHMKFQVKEKQLLKIFQQQQKWKKTTRTLRMKMKSFRTNSAWQ